jgi:Transposase DDE domain
LGKFLKMFNIGSKLGKLYELHTYQLHLSRKKFIMGFVLGMIKKQSVVFTAVAKTLNAEVQNESHLRRIQDFFANFALDYIMMARLLMSLVPIRELTLSIDRTNWQINGQNINILCLCVYYKGCGLPILFELLDKPGNSNQLERIDLLTQFVDLFGVHRIECVIGDREFIGEKWYQYLITNQIGFYLRLPKSHKVITPSGDEKRMDALIDSYPSGAEHWLNQIQLNHHFLNLGFKKLLKDGKNRKEDDYLAILTNQKGYKALRMYQKRWSIETFFQSIKRRGFDIEATHLTQIDRIKKLFALVALAFSFCVTLGWYQHSKVKSIPLKNHGYKQNSFFRNGVDSFENAFERIATSLDFILTKIQIIIDFAAKNIQVLKLNRIPLE